MAGHELIQRLSGTRGALRVLAGRCLRVVGLYGFSKHCEASFIRICKTVADENKKTPEIDFLITHCEINDRHGVGLLLKTLFGEGKQFLCIRSRNVYDAEQNFGASSLCVSHWKSSRQEVHENIQQVIGDKVPRRIVCAPYFSDDVLTAIALRDLFEVPLCTYLMDDQNVCVNNIPDHYMQELLEKSNLCFGIAPELCDAYEAKYNRPFYYCPPAVPSAFIQDQAQLRSSGNTDSENGILIGNIWSQQWLDRLRTVVKEVGIGIDWYGNPNRQWLVFEERELEDDGINYRGHVPVEKLVQALQDAPYAIIPTGSKQHVADRPEIAKLSLPSSLVFAMATANTPTIVLGRKDSAAARFVEWHGIGVVCDYDIQDLRKSVDHISSIHVQHEMRERAALLAPTFSADGLAEWIWNSLAKGKPHDQRFEVMRNTQDNIDVVITYNEMNQRHGTGALVRRIFEGSDGILSIRSNDHYGGDHEFGDIAVCLHQRGQPPSEVFRSVSCVLSGITAKRILCVPYHSDELITSIAVKELTGAPLGAYIMDDQNISVNEIPDDLMQEFLERCSLRLATHPELRDAYEQKYGLKFWVLPAVVPHHLVSSVPQAPDEGLFEEKTGALLGSFWSEKWFDMLCKTINGSDVRLDWYGNAQYAWLNDSHEEMQQRGIKRFGIIEEQELANRLRKYPYVVVPTGTLDWRDDRPHLSRLSLPGRIVFALATSNTPIILLGDKETSAGHFVNRHNIGIVCHYNPQSFRKAVAHITQPNVQREIRQCAASIAGGFSDKGVAEWVWRSLELGEPCDLKFEKLMTPSPEGPEDNRTCRPGGRIETTSHRASYEFAELDQEVILLLKTLGYQPQIVFDVGASTGEWSSRICEVLPEAEYHLFEPLIDHVPQYGEHTTQCLKKYSSFSLHKYALGDASGERIMNLYKDPLGSTTLKMSTENPDFVQVPVKMLTLDEAIRSLHLPTPQVIKIDTQGSELSILKGAQATLRKVDVLFLECWLYRAYGKNTPLLTEISDWLIQFGFRLWDVADSDRAENGVLRALDYIFVNTNGAIGAISPNGYCHQNKLY
ncbi:MAG: FkbM family methyltransferase [Deltaproteobacteria bacterium]|nr:FkbM family methyltransferase [Deltaproteobacteria bacterium]